MFKIAKFLGSSRVELAVYENSKKLDRTQAHLVCALQIEEKSRAGIYVPGNLEIKVAVDAAGKAVDEKKQALLSELEKLKQGQIILVRYQLIGSGKDANRWYQSVSLLALDEIPHASEQEVEASIFAEAAVAKAMNEALVKAFGSKKKGANI